MWQNMQRAVFFVPFRPVQIEPVLRQRRQVYYTEYRTMVRPCICIVRRRFAKIVKPSPYKLAYNPGIIVVHGKINIRRVRPRTCLVVVTITLVIGVHLCVTFLPINRKMVNTSRRNSRCGFRTKYYLLRKFFKSLLIMLRLIIKPRYVERGGKAIVKHGTNLIHATCNRPRRI